MSHEQKKFLTPTEETITFATETLIFLQSDQSKEKPRWSAEQALFELNKIMASANADQTTKIKVLIEQITQAANKTE